MMKLNRRRILSFLLALSMTISLIPSNIFTIFAVDLNDSESVSAEKFTSPFTPDTPIPLPDGSTTTSQSYRIPSMVTLSSTAVPPLAMMA